MANEDGDVIEMTVIHDNAVAGVQLNRYQYQLSTGTPVDDATLLDDVAFIIEALYDIVKTIIAVQNVFREIRVVNKTQDLLIGSTDAGAYDGGISTGSAAPPAVSSFVHLTTNVPRVILSKYLPSPSVEDVQASGELAAIPFASLVEYAGALLEPFVFNGTLYTYGYDSPKALEFVIPQVATASRDFAYQRRRKAGRGA